MAMPDNIQTTFLRLRPDCSVEKLPVNEHFWPKLMTGQLGQFHHEYMVSHAEFSSDWPSWEMHPAGDEVVCLLSGQVTLVLEQDGGERSVTLQASGDYVLVPKGTWHKAKTQSATKMLFITPGEGTQSRPV
jgi:mannose-6-phosphate isomerase-like protein (cupin superfamily)